VISKKNGNKGYICPIDAHQRIIPSVTPLAKVSASTPRHAQIIYKGLYCKRVSTCMTGISEDTGGKPHTSQKNDKRKEGEGGEQPKKSSKL
jgi:hypothetical protein